MFWNKSKISVATKDKSNINDISVITNKDIIIPTKEIVQKELIDFNSINKAIKGELTNDEHLNKYLSVLERVSPEKQQVDNNEYSLMEAFSNKGFNLFIRAKCINYFKYAAEIWNDDIIPSVALKYSKYSEEPKLVQFTGDIPDFALDKIQTIRDIKLSYVFGGKRSPIKSITVHSNTELPCEYIKLQYKDPVIIAWETNPEVIITKKGCELYDSKNEMLLGTIVAMWGDDGKEL